MEYVFALWEEFAVFIGRRGGAMHWLLFVAALAGCFFMGRRERRLFFWPSVLVLSFFFNPLLYRYVGTRFLSGVYWRLLWMLPISFVIAYVLAKLVYQIPKNAMRILAVTAACVCIFATGEPIFSQDTYGERENLYELPTAAIEICDYIKGELSNWKETIIVPNELLCDIRQYSSAVCLLYGRNSGGFISDIEEDEQAVFEQMSRERPDVALVTEVARNRNCRYIIFNSSFHEIPEDMTEYGYERVEVIEDIYEIYRRIE